MNNCVDCIIPARSTSAVMSHHSHTAYLQYFKLFCMGALLYLAAVLPFVLYRGGYFFYYGDYNVQQVPFYILAHRAVRSGNLFWNWNVDLGSSMGGSFAFYLWGSPFFWFSCLFPEKWIPYLMPVLMSLKYGTAMCTSYAWLRGFVKTDRAGMVGALLYSFSGFQACNIVFQHFHEAVALFPLYLLALDRAHAYILDRRISSLRKNNDADSRDRSSSEGSLPRSVTPASAVRSGSLMGFILMTSLMSVVNYFFFYGQVLFLILYYIIRYAIGDRQRIIDTLKEALQLVLAGALGLCLSAFFLIQVYDVVAGNSRLSDMLLGYDMVAYSEQTTPLAILKSFFMVPDIIGRGSLFTNEQVKNSSLSLFLPCFAVSGAYAWIRSHAGDWRKHLLLTCLVIMFVPVLNAAFALFNTEYYARWFYMPLLFLSLVTVLELEACDRKNLISGAVLTIVMDAVLILCALLPSAIDAENTSGNTGIAVSDTVQFFGIMEYPELFDVEALATCLMLPALLWIIGGQPRLRRQRAAVLQKESAGTPAPWLSLDYGMITRPAAVLIALCCLLTQMAVLYNGTSLIGNSGGRKWKSQMIDNVPDIPGYEDYDFQRIEADGTSTNYEMVWGMPTTHCFQSTVSPGIFRFYHGIGYNRTVDSKMNLTHAGARALLSDRYYLDNNEVSHEKTFESEGGLPGYEKAGESDGYLIYQNMHYIPMGFTFDSCMTEDAYSSISDRTAADRLLVKNIILSREDVRRFRHLFAAGAGGQDTDIYPKAMSDTEYLAECDRRAAAACTSFVTSSSGFSAVTSDLPQENLVFFSVPFDKGWTATVDGMETEIIQADFGLSAVDVPAGVHEIVFTFLPWGLKPAAALSCAAAAVIVCLCIREVRSRNRRQQ